MGFTLDIIPMGPGESPEAAIDRIYEGGMEIGWTESEDGWEASAAAISGSGGEQWRPPEGWSEPIIEMLTALHEWQSDETDGESCFWSSDVLWQVEFNPDDVTFRKRRDVSGDPSGPSDAELLGVFTGLPFVIHQPGDGWWILLDEIGSDFRLLG